MNYPVDSVIHLSNLAGVLVVINDYVSIVYFLLFFFSARHESTFQGVRSVNQCAFIFFLNGSKSLRCDTYSSDESHSKRVHLACQMAKSLSIDFL